jgi:protein-disulfide isomerase
MSKGFLGVIVLVILAFAGIFALSGNKANAPSNNSKNGTLTQHIEGQGKSGVTLVEYGDYQCPFCGQYYPTVKQVQTQFNNQIYFQFRNFPLVNLHQNAFAAARAAEAAAMQNKFWEMHDALYESQTQWSKLSDAVPYFNQLAQQLGLDITKFKADYASGKVNNLINADVAEGTKLNIQGTPTFFLDGKVLNSNDLVDSSSQPSASAFAKLINAEIAKKSHAQ